MNETKAKDRHSSSSIRIPANVVRNSLVIYLISVVVLPIICLLFGFKTLGGIGTGLMYGSLCFVLFGILTSAGNTVPAQLSKLSLPKYKASTAIRHEGAAGNRLQSGNEGKYLLFTSLISGVSLFVTGLLIKLLS